MCYIVCVVRRFLALNCIIFLISSVVVGISTIARRSHVAPPRTNQKRQGGARGRPQPRKAISHTNLSFLLCRFTYYYVVLFFVERLERERGHPAWARHHQEAPVVRGVERRHEAARRAERGSARRAMHGWMVWSGARAITIHSSGEIRFLLTSWRRATIARCRAMHYLVPMESEEAGARQERMN